jgi:hypothetical protein
MQEPPTEPGVRIVLPPFPSVSPFRVAGLGEHQELLASALVRALSRHRALVMEILAGPLPAGARALALSQLARMTTGVALPQRLAWCQQAAAAALEIETLPLRHLLLAEAARATHAAGAGPRALELARQTVSAMEPHFAQGDTMVVHAYASALGRCVGVAIRREAWTVAWDWLWLGRALGMHGFYVMLGEVAEAMQAVAPVPIERLEAAEAAGRNFYVTG